jgi:hypothetical protein
MRTKQQQQRSRAKLQSLLTRALSPSDNSTNNTNATTNGSTSNNALLRYASGLAYPSVRLTACSLTLPPTVRYAS